MTAPVDDERTSGHASTLPEKESQPDVAAATLVGTPWRPMGTAPRDGTKILGLCVHDEGIYYHNGQTRLTTYAAHAEGLAHVEDGLHVLEWGGEYREYDWESQIDIYIPPWWFLSNSGYEIVANPIAWMPIPDTTKLKEEDLNGHQVS